MANGPVNEITEHYQKSFELTFEMWKERNNLFVYLVLTAGIGLLLILRIPEANSLLVDTIVKLLSMTDSNRIKELQNNFPFDILLTGVLIIVFYLMQKLYATNLSVLRYYLYLGAMENEIRQKLGLSEKEVSFTREGKFYWGRRSITQNISKWSYVFVVFITLLPFMLAKIMSDFPVQNISIVSVDIVVSLLTLVYLWGYARSAVELDVPNLPVSNSIEGKKSVRKKQ